MTLYLVINGFTMGADLYGVFSAKDLAEKRKEQVEKDGDRSGRKLVLTIIEVLLDDNCIWEL